MYTSPPPVIPTFLLQWLGRNGDRPSYLSRCDVAFESVDLFFSFGCRGGAQPAVVGFAMKEVCQHRAPSRWTRLPGTILLGNFVLCLCFEFGCLYNHGQGQMGKRLFRGNLVTYRTEYRMGC